MNARRWLTAAVLLALIAAAVAGLVWTRERAPAQGGADGGTAAGKAQPRRKERLVDMKPLLTARKLAALATTPEEQELARQAERLADHAVDLAFADMLAQAADNPPQPTPEIRELAARKEKAQATVSADRREVERVARRLESSPEEEKGAVSDQLEVAKAQLELHQDELAQAGDDLARAGGDPQARIRRLKEAYEAAQKEPRPAPTAAPDAADDQGSLISRLRGWAWQRKKLAQLDEAMRDSQEKVQRLTGWREKLAQRVRDQAAAQAAAQQAAAQPAAPRPDAPAAAQGQPVRAAPAGAAGAISELRRLAANQRWLIGVGKRIVDHQELADVYQNWKQIADGHARAALNRVLRGLLWVLLTLAAVFVATRVVEHLFHRFQREEVRTGTLRTVVKFVVQLVGVLAILLILFGVPSQMTTVLGLAGAGLTVAMKDFIVAFFGWFILMGRNGIRVGDWVEIKGVGGEVAEIGLLHTVLLETGAWTDAGHPTGRRVSFVNSFAIEGHYFNFSTSGQWMWDELRTLIPPGQDPYPVIDGVQKLVENATAANARLAEQEWRKAASRYRVRTFSAVPGINVVPTSSGVEIHVRYITRAHERHETRRSLYHAMVELMHGKRPEVGAVGAAAS